MRHSTATLFVTLALFAAPAFAQHEQGDKSLSGYGSIMFMKNSEDSLTGSGTVGARFGVFAGANLEIGALTSLSISGSGDGTDVAGTLGGFITQYFKSDRTRPYVGLQAQALLAPGLDTTPFIMQGTLGLRHYMNRNSAFFVEGAYGATRAEGETYWDDFPTINFGFTVVF